MKSLPHKIASKSNQYDEVNKINDLCGRSWFSAIHRFNQVTSTASKNSAELFGQKNLPEKYDNDSDKNIDSKDLSDIMFTSANAANVHDEKTSLLWAESLKLAEEQWRKLSVICQLQQTAHPTIFCSTLPRHWRSNKSLPTPFVVLALHPISDGTQVTVSAGNDENPTADVKNCTAEFCGQMARFVDLRFVGKSGRGKNFNLTITIYSEPVNEVAIVNNAIKVTVDGPRDSRNTNKNTANSQNQSIPSRKRPCSSSSTNDKDDDLQRDKSKKINNNDSIAKRNVMEKTLEKFNDRFQWRRRRAAKRTRIALKNGNAKQNDRLFFNETVQPYDAQSYNSMLATSTLSATIRQEQSQSHQCRQLLSEQITTSLAEFSKKSKYNAQNNPSSLAEQNNLLLSLQKNANTLIPPTFSITESDSQQQQILMQILTTALKNPDAITLQSDQQEMFSTVKDSSVTTDSIMIYQAILQQHQLQKFCKQSFNNRWFQQSLSHENKLPIFENNETSELLMNSTTSGRISINDMMMTTCNSSGITIQQRKCTPPHLSIKSENSVSKKFDFHLMKNNDELITSASNIELQDEFAASGNNTWLDTFCTEEKALKVDQIYGRSISHVFSASTSKRTKNSAENCDNNDVFTNFDTVQENNNKNRENIDTNLKSCTKTSSHLWRPFDLSDDLETVKQYVQY